jgi:hypothetical protein
VLHPALERAVDRYVRLADRLLPGRLEGFYVVGSAALGAFRPSRSDVDFVAVVDRDLTTAELRRLRALHAASAVPSGLRAAARGRLALPGVCNGVFVRAGDLTMPVSEIEPVGSHVGYGFHRGRGFDVNPVVWKVLAEAGIAVRGPTPDTLGLDPQPELLRAWTLANLDSYWRRWGEATLRSPGYRMRLQPRWSTAWGVLGAPRLHRTIATGDVISKEAAGEYALAAFDERWRPIVREALAYWRAQPAAPAFRDVGVRAHETAAFVLEVVRAAGGP